MLFSELYKTLFNPLNENKKQPSGPAAAANRAKSAARGSSKLSPQEQRRLIVERFISRWRSEVGDDFYPALRLIVPSQDRDRSVYGLKENAIGKLLVKIMRIDKNSEDGYALLHWKNPGKSVASRMAGDFSGRCYEVLSKRPVRMEPGTMTIADVNEKLDKLAAASGEAEQRPILEDFYRHMNAEELMWLIRIILKQMKVGATERTFLELWHPDGEALFSVSSSIRRVCWELTDPNIRLDDGAAGITPFQSFQPQLAHYQISGSFQKMVSKLMRLATEDDNDFWIEEKLDGERMQMHMMQDSSVRGGMKFGFWSRKAHDYTYLYGHGFLDDRSSLTRHLKSAFADGVRNIILDGEMVTWDMDIDKIMNFGTLKTAALAAQRNPYDNIGPRPVFRVFDILYLNDKDLTKYYLRDRRNALQKAVPGVHRRLEIHPYEVSTSADTIEPMLRRVIADAGEGLVIKNPRSIYKLNSRNDDWIKVKPEYMNDLGENVDVVVIGGYYGSGHRGGKMSSFLCGLRATENDIRAGADPEKCFSFCKVGGGFKGEDYQQILRLTEGKWSDWDVQRPPRKYIELGGSHKQSERPDRWIRPSESIVISAKAASLGPSDSFAQGITLRFPRFKELRLERSWDTALNYDELMELRKRMEEAGKDKAMKMESRRQSTKRVKRDLVIAGQDAMPVEFGGPRTQVFENLEFCVLSDCSQPKKTKTQLETLIKENGGKISQKAEPGSSMLLIGDKKVVKVASLMKAGNADIIRPKWVLDCIDEANQAVLPYEPSHLYQASDQLRYFAEQNVDEFGDSYARATSVEELKKLLGDMPKKEIVDDEPFNKHLFLAQLEQHGHDFGALKSQLFRNLLVYFALGENQQRPDTTLKMRHWIGYGSGRVTEHLDNEDITHIVIVGTTDQEERDVSAEIRREISSRRPVPHVVTQGWLEECWSESTLLAEERYAPRV